MNKLPAVRDPDRMYCESDGCYCAACGDAIVPGEAAYFTGEGHLHEECLREYVLEEFGTDELARSLGFVRQ
ncbi:MAG: DUF2175 domain-containing protein [Clostridia bacterium]|nr:DUF2175 domain-containing protein [Clostridia bacterium]